MTDRACIKCSVELVPGSFYDGRKNVCKECHKEEMRARRKVDDEYEDHSDDSTICKQCASPLPSDVGAYYLTRKLCRSCHNKHRKRKRDEQEETPEEEGIFEVVETFKPEKKSHLYVMSNPRIPDENKKWEVDRPRGQSKGARQISELPHADTQDVSRPRPFGSNSPSTPESLTSDRRRRQRVV